MQMRKNALPPLDQLRELFIPNFELGTLTWAKDVNVRRHKVAGTSAGSADPAKGGRVIVGIKGRRFYRYHILWVMYYGEDPWPLVIDHIDRNPSNDAIANLRAVTQLENMSNLDFLRKKSAKLLPGVRRRQRGNSVRFNARIIVSGKYISLGYFATEAEAHNAYRAALREHGRA